VNVVEFIDDMKEAFQWADLVIGRSGASTVTELAEVGLPAIFIPFPYAIDDHQTANAEYLVKAGKRWEKKPKRWRSLMRRKILQICVRS